jgi:cell division transport system ATP-binding protein
VARAIVNRPAIVLADEPTGNLDTEYANEIMEMFRSFNQVGVTLLIATHDEQLIARYGGKTLHLKQGELQA